MYSHSWQPKVSDNQIAGTTGKGKRVEAIKITLPDSDYTGNVEYQAFVTGNRLADMEEEWRTCRNKWTGQEN